jgi:uncharacterized surface protein with fasciclin (FAS1) repeats
METSQHKMTMGVVMAVIALLIGGGVGYAIGHHNKSMTKDSSMSMMSSSSDGVTVGGAKMVQSKDIVDNAVNAKNVTTLVSAVKAAGLVDTLKGSGPFTVFAPNNDAFAALPTGTLDTLLKPANKDQLTNILTYHVVSGTYTTAALKVMAEKGQSLTTVEGEMLTPIMQNNTLKLKDAKGNIVSIQTPDVISSNGVTDVISSVLMP